MTAIAPAPEVTSSPASAALREEGRACDEGCCITTWDPTFARPSLQDGVYSRPMFQVLCDDAAYEDDEATEMFGPEDGMRVTAVEYYRADRIFL